MIKPYTVHKEYNKRNHSSQIRLSLTKFILNSITIYVSIYIYYENIFYN